MNVCWRFPELSGCDIMIKSRLFDIWDYLFKNFQNIGHAVFRSEGSSPPNN